MLTRFVLLGIFSGLLATLASYVYGRIYFVQIADFSEAVGVLKLLTYCLMTTLLFCFIGFAFHWLFKGSMIGELIFNLIVAGLSFAVIFYVLKINDPVFKNEDAMLMSEFYKGFLMPMLFFPAIAWFVLKPVFFQSK